MKNKKSKTIDYYLIFQQKDGSYIRLSEGDDWGPRYYSTEELSEAQYFTEWDIKDVQRHFDDKLKIIKVKVTTIVEID